MREEPAPNAPRDPALLRPSRHLLIAGGMATAFFSVGLPVGITVALGDAPYKKLFQSFPGLDVGVTTTALLVASDTGILLSMGILTHLLFLRATPAKRAMRLEHGFELRVLRVTASVWAASAAGLAVFEAFDTSGVPLSRILEPGTIAFLFEASYPPAAWTISCAGALVVLFASFFVDRWTGMLIPLWGSFLATLAPVVSGQILVGPDHDFGGDAAVFQSLAINLLFGVVAVYWLRVCSGRFIDPESLRRLFLLAAVLLPVIAASDVVITFFKLAGTPLLGSLTGWLIVGRWAALLIVALPLIALRSLWRRARVRAVHIVSCLSVASFGVIAWIGATAAMTRQPPPQYFVPTSISQTFMGFEVADPPSIEVLFGHWRPNVLFLTIATAAVVVYLVAVRALHRRGDQWPPGRTVAWLLGWAIIIFATSSGFGKYSAPDFGIHMIVHMSLNMLAPGMLVLGGIVTLLLRATRSVPGSPVGPHDWITWVLHWRVLQFLYNPLIVFVVFIGSYYGLYLTGIFGEYMRFHWAHQLMNLHFLIVGYLYYSLIIGVDRPPRPLPHVGKLGYALAAMPFHAFFGIILMTSTTLIAENFYLYLKLPWADLPAQQYLAGGVAWAGGEIPLLIVIIVLLIQWGRQDSKEARRKDRHLDTGRDVEFDAYNEMLRQLSARSAASEELRPGPQPEKEPQR